MARGILFGDFFYEVDDLLADGSREANARMLIKMDVWNIHASNAKKIKEATSNGLPLIKAHVSNYLNEKEFGVHPRHLVGELVMTALESKCYGITPKRIVRIPVLTLAQFDAFKVFNKKLSSGVAQPNTLISVCHSRDGSVNIDYKIVRKIDQVLI